MNVSDMLAELRKPAEPMYLKTKDGGGTKVSYIPWYNAVALADARLGGRWDPELVEHWVEDAQRGSSAKGYTATPLAHVRVRVTIFGDDRQISREAVGVDDEPNGQRGTPMERAEAAGLRRALAKFGLGLHLYGGAATDERSYTQAPRPGRSEAAGAPPPRQAPQAEPRFTERIAAATTSAQVDALLAEIAKLDQPQHRANAEKLAFERLVELALPVIPKANAATLDRMHARLAALPSGTAQLNQALDQIIVRSSALQVAEVPA